MNLVQIQERLKDAPVQAVMQYANGGNPMVPPYLALAELKRRESINQSAQAQQAMQQGQPPSVKDQVEQAAGLAALQQQMQQQGMQGLMAQARPQGIPENVPQPRRQPESEGIAGLPAGDFNFADGGIVAFAEGNLVSGDRVLSIDEMRREYKRLLQAGKPVEANAMLDRIKKFQPTEHLTVQTPVTPYDETPQPAEVQRDVAPSRGQSTPAQYQAAKFEFQGGAPEYAQAMREAATIPDPQDRAAAIAALQRAQPQAGISGLSSEVQPSGIATLPGAEQASKMMVEAMQKQSTPEGAYEAERKMTGLYGLTKPAGEERMQRAGQMEAERKKMLEERGMERLMRVMGGVAGRGLQGAGPAYLSAIEGERASDVAFRKQMDELLGGVEEKRRAEQVAGMQRATAQMGEERKLALGAAEKIMDMDTKFKLQELQQKAVLGRLSAEEQYILSEIQKGRSYPDIVGKIAEAKAGPRSETAEQQRYKDTYLKVAKAYEEMLVKPKDISRDDYIRREVDRAMGVQPIGSTAVAAPADISELLKKYGSR